MKTVDTASGPVISPSFPDAGARTRIQSLDILRGLVMILMALDHVRDYFHTGAQHFDPTDMAQTTAILFLTRWITHFCAPTFMFLAGAGAYLQVQRGRSRSEVARFLATRGIWLVILEFTYVLCLGWKMNFAYDQIYLIVIWALGVSMIALAGLSFLPWRALLVLSLAVIALHHTLDGITPAQFGSLGWLWNVLHVPGFFRISSHTMILSFYPLIPWVFVMSAGYCFGRVMDLTPDRRKRFLLRFGGLLTAAFVLLRWSNLYGDPRPWSPQSSAALTIASFLNCSKYPPSLLYLLMTLGPAILFLGLVEGVKLRDSNPLIVFGRVPLFYYLLHLPLIHGLQIFFGLLRYGRVDFLLNVPPALDGAAHGFPPDYGYSLGVVYLLWIATVLILYPACLWFARVKARNRSVLLSYL